MGPILCSYYEKSLVSSNSNSKLFRFHSAHPNEHRRQGKGRGVKKSESVQTSFMDGPFETGMFQSGFVCFFLFFFVCFFKELILTMYLILGWLFKIVFLESGENLKNYFSFLRRIETKEFLCGYFKLFSSKEFEKTFFF